MQGSGNNFTYIPLNVDYTGYLNENNVPNYASYYASNSSEKPLNTNSGYIVGAGTASTYSSSGVIRNRIDAYSMIYKSTGMVQQTVQVGYKSEFIRKIQQQNPVLNFTTTGQLKNLRWKKA